MSTAPPLRVLMMGASTLTVSSDKHGPSGQYAIPRTTEAQLYAAGRPATVRAVAVPSQRAKSALRIWQDEILTWSPDVVVLGYGFYESIHALLPWWLERHANSARGRTGRVRTLYRRRVLRAVWIALAKVQVRVDGRLRAPLFRGPRRVAADVGRLISHARSVASPLVIVLAAHPPTGKMAGWFPGMAGRVTAMNAELDAVVSSFGTPDVRLFDTDAVLARFVERGVDPTPDGLHFGNEVHAELGRELAGVIDEWRGYIERPASSRATGTRNGEQET